ncbi:hypothetical protein GALMADRAFT_245562 [Galerina marginata CBS 339.88]|uniref:Uncharacterized protein n=1 Tax=Galerina marginata (strain CBS 339.88) TaxID=685588 RepID=A0A067TET3_GALM3|nr:hypothetical protein GALMADRAFT_245562 [Galerina marginata CBS 339.88]
MNHPYGYPPPGVGYASPVSPRVPYIVAGTQYSSHPPPGLNSNGLYPGYSHHYPPGAQPPPPRPYMPRPPNYHVDNQGWYTPQYPPAPDRPTPMPTGPPQHPPGLTIPPHLSPQSNEEKPVLPPPAANPHFHDFWKGRLAPLPGYLSRPILLPMRENAALVETESTVTQKEESPVGLLPPQSFFGPSYERKVPPSPTSPLKSSINNVKTQEKTDKTKKDFKFDTYAESYVPQYLYNIQKQVHPLKPLPPTPVFPSTKYLESFLIPRLIEESRKSDNLSLLHAPPPPKDSKPSILTHTTYHNHWTDILRWELDAIASKKEQIVLWKAVVRVVVWKDSEFVLSVPGIRENHPHLEIGDLVHMREVFDEEKRSIYRALEGRVVALRKREGLVHISSEPLRSHIQTYVPLTLETTKTENGYIVLGPEDVVSFKFNISFMTNARPLCLMQNAVGFVANILNAEETGVNLARQWIFPEPEDFTNAPSMLLKAGIAEEQWVDQGLNAEQRLAVTSVALYQSPVPHLIGGPPGTGKTRTVVETVLQIFKIQPEACILLCAPSNPATDTLVLRLQKHLLQHEMFRLNDPNRTFAEVPDIIKPYCYVENDKFSLPPWKKLMQYRVVVCSCLDASILVGAQCTNTKLMTMEEEITASLHPNRKPKHVVQPHWTHLLIDEAAQGSEPELLIPISVVLPDVYYGEAMGRTFMPQLALCGDVNQLGPIVASDEARSAEFEVSLLERLFERPLYAQSRQDSRLLNGSSKRLPPYTTLVKNYRSHPVILMPPSAIFYNDTLEPCATNGKISWSGLAKPQLPLKFIGTDSVEKSNDERASWYNPGQINVVVDVVKSLLDDPRKSDPPLRPSEISVMAPWRKQVWTLRKRLRNEGLTSVDVGTVEDYQGRENRVVIISCVRSSERFLEDDHKKGLGLIFERKRMNVAITRAKELLVVIGNGAILQRDPYWKSFLQFALRNGLYEGPGLSLEMDGNYISRLESELVQSGSEAADLDPEEQGLRLAGGVAREVLRE